MFNHVLITGGGGYVGSRLVPELLGQGYRVRVLDLFWYGENVYPEVGPSAPLELFNADLRDVGRVREAMAGIDAVIHLACISNDPSFELDANLGRSINYEAFRGLLEESARAGVKRFIYASSSSVYGVKEKANVTEDDEPLPLTDYSKYKLLCEQELTAFRGAPAMEKVILRPATVCGYAPRLRLDLTVNILTIHALVNKRIRIFGGKQLRPNIHIRDMVRVYRAVLESPREKADGGIFNAGYENHSVEHLARLVKSTIGDESIELEYVHSDDNRSYHIDSSRIRKVLGFEPAFTIEDAVRGIVAAYRAGKIPNAMTDPLYYNIRRMQELKVA